MEKLRAFLFPPFYSGDKLPLFSDVWVGRIQVAAQVRIKTQTEDKLRIGKFHKAESYATPPIFSHCFPLSTLFSKKLPAQTARNSGGPPHRFAADRNIANRFTKSKTNFFHPDSSDLKLIIPFQSVKIRAFLVFTFHKHSGRK